jgi:hypothetical protein
MNAGCDLSGHARRSEYQQGAKHQPHSHVQDSSADFNRRGI